MADVNLSSLSDATSAAQSLANLILVTPNKIVGYQPQNGPSYQRDTSQQAPSILFNYEGENTAALQSDITDHYTEDNMAIQDQIALKPVTITTHGFVGELNDIAPGALQPLKVIAEKLTTVGAYVPSLSTTALIAYTNAFQLYQVGKNIANSAVSVWASINGAPAQTIINGSTQIDAANLIPAQTQQQIYFQQFYGYWQDRTLFTIQTPWAVFQDMAILSLTAIQDESTRMITDFNITFKQMRFARTDFILGNTLYNNNNFQGRASAQGADEVNLGTSTLSDPVAFRTA